MSSVFRWFSIVAVTIYLCLVLLFLIVTFRVRPPRVFSILAARLRRPYKAEVKEIEHEDGHCYVTQIPKRILSDRDSRSRLVVLEGGKPLPAAHSAHADIRCLGEGRYSHWGDTVYFSSSDNTDPRCNSRKYSVAEDVER